MKVNKIQDEEWLGPNCDGMCVELDGVEGHTIVVQIDPKSKHVFENLLHESVHVWQYIIENMSEDSPGDETEAYTIAHIFIELMKQFQRLTGEECAIHAERKKGLPKRSPVVHIETGSKEKEG